MIRGMNGIAIARSNPALRAMNYRLFYTLHKTNYWLHLNSMWSHKGICHNK